VRRHGPRGYTDYASYRPWLRDEFSFRCVYCLLRERWVTGGFHLDHFLPVVRHPGLTTEYDNLLYSCARCNAEKRDLELPDPTRSFVGPAVQVLADGTILAKTADAAELVRALDLNSPTSRAYRSMWIDILALAARHSPELYHRLLAYPDDLPDLSSLRPPDGNTRPDGVAGSHFQQRQRGTLPATY
jgi:hypothetical protein